MIKFSPLILILFPLGVFSQNEFYNTGSVVCVQKGALLHVQGTITNAPDTVYSSTGSFTNNGIIELDGDFNVVSGTTFQPDPGTSSTDRAVKFTGLGTQFIKGTGTATFYNLVLDKQSATDTVKMQTNVSVSGSLVFNTGTTYSSYPSGVLTNSYNPSITSGITNNGLGGLLKTFDGTTYDGGTGNEYLLDIQNTDVGAINGYPALTVNGNPTTGYILTKGTSGSSNGGLQRAIGSASSYDYPIGTYLHGFNATRFNFNLVPGGTQTVKGKFCDYETSASGISGTGYTGTIDVTCIGCWGNYAAPDNLGYNYYFANDPCTSQPQWFIMDGLTIKHGYWTFTSSSNNAFTYSLEAFPNKITGPASLTLETWRVLKYDDAGQTYGYDPSLQNWTSQILSQASTPTDLLTWSLNTGCYSGTGIPGGTYTGFSEFSLDKSNSDNALPVKLISLEAYPVNNTYIEVSWITSLEINNQGFKLQRSTDGLNFSEIDWVNGNGSTTTEHTYNYDDHHVSPDVVYYYRLIQVDNNGGQSPTDVVQAMITGGNIFVIGELYPNPASDQSSLNITTSLSQNINIKIYDIIGQQITSKEYSLLSGTNTISFNARPLAGGTYSVIIEAGDDMYSRKLVITK